MVHLINETGAAAGLRTLCGLGAWDNRWVHDGEETTCRVCAARAMVLRARAIREAKAQPATSVRA